MSSNSSRATGSPLINISKRIYNKIIANISSLLSDGMIFIDILKFLFGRIHSSTHYRSIVDRSMMDYYFIFIQMDTFWPFKIISVGRFMHVIDLLFIRSRCNDKISSNLRLILLLENIPQFTGTCSIIRRL